MLTATPKEAAAFAATIVGDAEVIEGGLADGGAEITFTGEAGQVVRINVASYDFDPAVALIDRDDTELVYSDDSRGQNDPLIGPFRLPYSGGVHAGDLGQAADDAAGRGLTANLSSPSPRSAWRRWLSSEMSHSR